MAPRGGRDTSTRSARLPPGTPGQGRDRDRDTGRGSGDTAPEPSRPATPGAAAPAARSPPSLRSLPALPAPAPAAAITQGRGCAAYPGPARGRREGEGRRGREREGAKEREWEGEREGERAAARPPAVARCRRARGRGGPALTPAWGAPGRRNPPWWVGGRGAPQVPPGRGGPARPVGAPHMVRRGPPATRAQPGPAPPRSAPAAGSSSRGTAQPREPSGSGRRAPGHAGMGPAMSPLSAAAPPGICWDRPRDRRGHSGHPEHAGISRGASGIPPGSAAAPPGLPPWDHVGIVLGIAGNEPGCHWDPTGIQEGVGAQRDQPRDCRDLLQVSHCTTRISSGLLPGSPGSATGSLKSAQDHQDHAKFTPGITRATPGSALLFSWDLSGIPLSPQCGISLGSPLGSSGSHQEQMGDHGGHTWMSCRAARITRATPGSLVGQAGSYWDLSASHWDHPQDHGNHTWTPTPLGTRSLGLFQASFALKITKIPLFPFTGHFPSSQSLEELLHGMVSEHFRRPSCFYDACSHGILQTTFTASNIEICGISPGLGAWCEQE